MSEQPSSFWIPDSIETEPIIGYRMWKGMVLNLGDGWERCLTALYSELPVWPKRFRMEATCPTQVKEEPFVPEADQPKLKSVTAYNGHTKESEHPAHEPPPYDGCTCGIHAYAKLGDVIKLGKHQLIQGLPLIGSVALWGKYIAKGDPETGVIKGYHAQFAYPQQVYCVTVDPEPQKHIRSFVLGVGEAYNIKVSFLHRDKLDSLVSYIDGETPTNPLEAIA